MRSRMLVVLGLGLLLSACTFHGAIREDFYRSQGGVGQKYPYKVAVVVDDHAKSVQVDGPEIYRMDFDLYKGLGKALQQELQTVFEKVSVVEGESKAKGYDILALVNVDVTSHRTERSLLSLLFIQEWPLKYKITLDLTLKDLRDGVVLASESQSEQFYVTNWRAASKRFRQCNALLSLSLGLLSPIAIPCDRDAIGVVIVADLESELPGVIRALVAHALSDRGVAAYARRRSGGPELASGPAPRMVPSSDVDVVPSGLTPRKKPAYAIVVGIEQYRQNLPRADFADHDARIVREYLVKVLGYSEENVVLLSNDQSTKSDLEKYVEKWLPNRVDQDDSVFVYFSGHGAPNPKTGDAYLVPFDGDPAYIETTGYSLKRLYDNLGKLPAKEVVVMLDSCFSGAGGRSVLAKGARPFVMEIENTFLAGGKTVVLSASSGDQVSSTYDKQGHGLLTYFFLKGLQGEADRNKDGAIDLAEVFDYLRPQVQRVARREFNNEQTPQLTGNPKMLSKGIRLLER